MIWRLAESFRCVVNVCLTQSQAEDFCLFLVEAQLYALTPGQHQLPLCHLQLLPKSPRCPLLPSKPIQSHAAAHVLIQSSLRVIRNNTLRGRKEDNEHYIGAVILMLHQSLLGWGMSSVPVENTAFLSEPSVSHSSAATGKLSSFPVKGKTVNDKG